LFAGNFAADHVVPEVVVRSVTLVCEPPLLGVPSATHEVGEAQAAGPSEYAPTCTAHDAPPFLVTRIVLVALGPSGPLVAVTTQKVGLPHETAFGFPSPAGKDPRRHEAPSLAEEKLLPGSRPPQPPGEHSDAIATQPAARQETERIAKSCAAGVARTTHLGAEVPAAGSATSASTTAATAVNVPIRSTLPLRCM
jgi:hypothetical protein